VNFPTAWRRLAEEQEEQKGLDMWHKNCPVCLFLIMTIALALPLHAREQVTLTTSDGVKVYADFYPASSSGSNPAAIRVPFIAPIELLTRNSRAFLDLCWRCRRILLRTDVLRHTRTHGVVMKLNIEDRMPDQRSVKIAGPHERNPIQLFKESGPLVMYYFVFRMVKRFRSQAPRAQVANQFQ